MTGCNTLISLIEKEPLIILKYDRGKMLGRFICLWWPIMLLCSIMAHLALLKHALVMLFIFSLIFIGSLLYCFVIIITNEFMLYNDCIVKRTYLSNETIYELNNAIYSNYTLWPREFIAMTSLNQRKNLLIFYGFIRKSQMKSFYEALSR